MIKRKWILFICGILMTTVLYAQNAIRLNEIAYEASGPKNAIIETTESISLPSRLTYYISDKSGKILQKGISNSRKTVKGWELNRFYYPIDFSSFDKTGTFRIVVPSTNDSINSAYFQIGKETIANTTLPAVLNYYNKQRANTKVELEIDRHLRLFGSEKTVDLHGGWADASGDISKYFSHLAYTNFMSPQQIPLVTWAFADILDGRKSLLDSLKILKEWQLETLYGADYLMRSLSTEGYFYMTVFSYFNKDPNARRVVGLRANSVTTDEYQCAFREGGGLAIAALARVANMKIDGDYTSKQYLEAAKLAYAHLVDNNTKYDDDGKENILDDYCALMASNELWITTNSNYYRDQCRVRAQNLINRISKAGYFISDDKNRPYWHASDAGLPMIALVRYLDKETTKLWRDKTLLALKKTLDYQLKITKEVSNPFGYARQSFLYKGKIHNGFFIPHDNESGWWWQGENARLASLATAALRVGRLVYPNSNGWGVRKDIATYAMNQLSWITGCNPFGLCFMYGFGSKNVPYMQAMLGHGSQKGGISNGITGKKDNSDGSGIDFKMEDNGNEWRWTEQWIPHSAYYMLAICSINK